MNHDIPINPDKTTYQAYAHNEQGALYIVSNGDVFDSISAAVKAARRECGVGWRVKIEDSFDGEVVKAFTIRQ